MASLEAGSISVVEVGQYFRLARMANWGPDIWYTALDQPRVFHLNLLDGTPEAAVETGRAVPLNIATNGRQVDQTYTVWLFSQPSG